MGLIIKWKGRLPIYSNGAARSPPKVSARSFRTFMTIACWVWTHKQVCVFLVFFTRGPMTYLEAELVAHSARFSSQTSIEKWPSELTSSHHMLLPGKFPNQEDKGEGRLSLFPVQSSCLLSYTCFEIISWFDAKTTIKGACPWLKAEAHPVLSAKERTLGRGRQYGPARVHRLSGLYPEESDSQFHDRFSFNYSFIKNNSKGVGVQVMRHTEGSKCLVQGCINLL